MASEALIQQAAERIYAWNREELNAGSFLPREFDRLHDIAKAAYRRDAELCLDAGEVEAAAEAMYEGMRAKFEKSPPGPPWAELADDGSDPRRYYRERARVALDA